MHWFIKNSMAKEKKTSRRQLSGDRRVSGLGAASGIAIGPAHVRGYDDLDIPEYSIAKRKVHKELERLDRSVAIARRQIRTLQDRAKKMRGAAGEELSLLFDAYLAMLDDSRLVRGARAMIETDRINAEAAVNQQLNELARRFEAMDDAYIAARLDDIREVGTRLLRNLTRRPDKASFELPKGSILIAEQLSPADMAQIDPERVSAVAATLGGMAGHTAIMARALGIPAVLGAAELLQGVQTGSTVIVDGYEGTVVVDPSSATIKKYEKRNTEMRRKARGLERLRDQPAISRDGVTIRMMANVELPLEMEMVQQAGAEGIGLLRTEFMFMNREDIPSEDEQVEVLGLIGAGIDDHLMTIRTLDVGGEKPAPALLANVDEAAASALGLRGIRLSLANKDTLRTQFRAILRIANDRNVRVLLPMVTTPSEVRKARRILAEEAKRMTRAGIKIPRELPDVGVMIEVPGAALAADALAQVSDFFAIGSNDLTMYTLAVDRTNEHVAHLFNSLHPAVLRLMQFSTQAALRARIPISICGEMAGDPRYTALLVGLGIHDLSMTAASIPEVKKRIREMDALAASQRAMQIMEQTDSGRIAMMIEDFNALA